MCANHVCWLVFYWFYNKKGFMAIGHWEAGVHAPNVRIRPI